MIRLTVPAGALTEEGRATVQRDLPAVLLRWEGGPPPSSALRRGATS
jgi:hypothetical protein